MSSVPRAPMAHPSRRFASVLSPACILKASRGVGLLRQQLSSWRVQVAEFGTQPSTEDQTDHHERTPCGEVEVIMGPMFAGKTTKLLSRVSEAQASGKRVVLVKSAVDTRYSVDHVVTHTGKQHPCLPLSRMSDLRGRLGEERYRQVDVVAVDEAQFIEDLAEGVMHAAEVDGKTVIVAGLSGDFRRERFGQLMDLVPKADRVTPLQGKCKWCSRPSLFTLRISASTRQELVGGAEAYAPVCRLHYKELHRVREKGAEAETEIEGEAAVAEATA